MHSLYPIHQRALGALVAKGGVCGAAHMSPSTPDVPVASAHVDGKLLMLVRQGGFQILTPSFAFKELCDLEQVSSPF